jgi:hydrogenase maturation protein HypF
VLDSLQNQTPPLAEIERITQETVDPEGHETFDIVASSPTKNRDVLVPPDTGICVDCQAEMHDPESRFHRYWATGCVNCGPRFTVTRSLPYDRHATAYDGFPLCPTCREEYTDPADRRYHGQTICCPDCGPTLQLTVEKEVIETGYAAIEDTGARVDAGDIVGVKGSGGCHFVCDATNTAAITALRERTHRPTKPFALMVPSVDAIRSFATVDDHEADLLRSPRRPIVLLNRDGDRWLNPVAPGIHTVGVMLPHSGLYHLLFDTRSDPLVVTSANLSGEPMATTKDELGKLPTDSNLVHNRDIVTRCDDSVCRVHGSETRFVRRSRGWVPDPVDGPAGDHPAILGVGAEFDTTAAFAHSNRVILSQHIGTVDGPASARAHEATVDNLVELLDVEPDLVACDIHPQYLTADYARERDEPVELVQHHHAHAASLLGEHDRNRAIVLALDGTGAGPDGTIWGGEVLDARRQEYERLGGLAPFELPGGDAAVRRPGRILADLLRPRDDLNDILVDRDAVEGRAAAETLRHQLDRGVNCPTTSSLGRLFDAIAALLDICTVRQYQGEPAMRLESAAAGEQPMTLAPTFDKHDGRAVLDSHALVRALANRKDEHSVGRLAATAHRTVAHGLSKLACDAADSRGVDAIGLTGGAAVNERLAASIGNVVESSGYQLLEHSQVPPGDGGLSYGQCIVAAARKN